MSELSQSLRQPDWKIVLRISVCLSYAGQNIKPMTSLSSQNEPNIAEKSGLAARFGRRLVTLRLQHGLSAIDLGQCLGMSSLEMGRLEQGSIEPDLVLLARISDALEVSLSDLLEEL